MHIKNALRYMPEHEFTKGDLIIRNGRFVSELTVSDREEVIDAEGLYAFPGFVDIHFHGAWGHDFCDADPDGLAQIAEYEASHGILAICPATMTLPEDELTGIMEVAARYRAENGSDLIGINMEGPFISPGKTGAQNPLYVKGGDIEMFHRLNEKSGGLIRLVDVAPEEENNLDFIRELSKEVRVSLAHTACDYETAAAAFDAGAKEITHLYNAMPDIRHREPGPVIAGLEKGADVELIADGIHVHSAMVRFTFRTFGSDKVILISDSMMAAGLSDGAYTLGGQDVTVKGNLAVLTDHPDIIAGSVTNLYDCARTAVRMGVPLTEAVRASSENPARAIGADKDYGSLKEGCYGNVILADKDLNIVKVIKKGRVLFPK